MLTKEEILEKLSENNHQVTQQRKYMIDLCMEAPGHFTAADLCELDKRRENRLSRATVYNSIHVFEKIGFLRELLDLGSPVYYEVAKSFHPHAVCTSCGDIVDIPVNLKSQIQGWELPFDVENVRMTIEGTCQSCAPV
ncbi:MAG: Fur family transcriptional regulator [bacterium]